MKEQQAQTENRLVDENSRRQCQCNGGDSDNEQAAQALEPKSLDGNVVADAVLRLDVKADTEQKREDSNELPVREQVDEQLRQKACRPRFQFAERVIPKRIGRHVDGKHAEDRKSPKHVENFGALCYR